MDLSNPSDTVMHYILIGEMTYFSYQDDFPMMSTLICMITH